MAAGAGALLLESGGMRMVMVSLVNFTLHSTLTEFFSGQYIL